MTASDDDEQGTAPPTGDDVAASASHCHGGRCRGVVEVALRAFLTLAEGSATDGLIALDELHRIGQAVMDTDGALGACYSTHASKCIAYFEMIECERKRKDFFGRIIAHPFSHMLDDSESGIERKNLPQYFAAVRMIVGEENNIAYRDQCTIVANELRDGSQSMPWDIFYEDPRTLAVLEEVQVAIARSFRHFDPRKDWFLILMNTDPESVSLATNAFVTKKSGDKLTHQFNDAHLIRLFKALFASVRPERFDEDAEAAFTHRHGRSPKEIFGNLFVELAALEQSQHSPSSSAPPRTMGFETRKKPGNPKRP